MITIPSQSTRVPFSEAPIRFAMPATSVWPFADRREQIEADGGSERRGLLEPEQRLENSNRVWGGCVLDHGHAWDSSDDGPVRMA